MMIIAQTIDEKSSYLDAVKRLWRPHSDTLGYMPFGAFDEHARDRHIVVAVRDGECVGYVLYRVVRDRVTIAHFCVAPEARKRGVARVMLDHLISSTKRHRRIILDCRRDYEASKSWPRLGFQPSTEKIGRAANGSEILRWVLDFGHPDLFSEIDAPTALEIAIDFNVFLDMVERHNDETEGLRADWIRPLISLCYTTELLNEINRNDDADARKKRKGQAKQFKLLSCPPEAIQNAEKILRPLFPTLDTPRDESDYRHLVYALATGADAFVTRDEALRDRADDVFAVCGLSVVRPAELIGRIDVIENERDYQRSFVAGTRRISQERLSSVDDALIGSVLAHGEHHKQLAAKINKFLADPQHVRCNKVVDSDGGALAVFSVESSADMDRVSLLRVCAKRKAGTLARSILTGLIREAAKTGTRSVFISDSEASPIVLDACSSLGFLPVNGGRLKLVPTGWLKIEDVPAMLAWSDPKIEELKALLPLARTEAAVASQIEHLLWPAKLADGAIPCFIVPIRPQFAEHLFDEGLANAGLFGADVDLALNPESAYYRAAKPAVVTSPARVLWYVSEKEGYLGSKAIRACSRVIEVLIDTPKRLHSRFRRLGVYEWSDVAETAKGDLDKNIMAFRFDDSELLRPIPWAKFQEILRANGVNNNLQSPVSISASVFGEIYASAFDPPDVRRLDTVGNEAR